MPGGIAVATGVLWLSQFQLEADRGFSIALFQAVSAFCTAGFSTASLTDWHAVPLAILIACMIIDGCSGDLPQSGVIRPTNRD